MTKADFLKAARAAAPHVSAQIEWLESQDPGEDDKAWFAALDVLEAERRVLLDKLDGLKERYDDLESEAAGWARFGAMAALDNAAQTARDERWDMDDIKNQIAVYAMATDEDTIREWLANNPA